MQVNPDFVGGVNTYVLGLLEGLATVGDASRFRLFVTRWNKHLFERFRQHGNFKIVVIEDDLLPLRSKFCKAALLSWNSRVYKFMNDFLLSKYQELIDAESDVLYTPTTILPCFNSRRATVLSMHDIQHVHHPEFFSWPRRLSRRITYDLSARHATYLQASSHYIKDDLINHFGWLSPEQIEVIPSGVLVEKFAVPSGGDCLAERYDLPDQFLLFPAQLWPHKNHVTVLKALKQIETNDGLKIPLVLTGARFSAAAKVFEFIADQSMEYVRYLDKVPSQDLVALYQKAAFMITATLHESSSLPILEAAAAGTPVIASRIPPIEEIGRVLQLNLFDPLNVDELAHLIRTLWRDRTIASSQASHNRGQIGFFSWENTARSYLKLFERAINS